MSCNRLFYTAFTSQNSTADNRKGLHTQARYPAVTRVPVSDGPLDGPHEACGSTD